MIRLLIGTVLLLNINWLHAQDENQDPSGTSLEDKIQNPIANMVSIPFNYNLSTNDDNTNVLNIQPVIPVQISKDWLMITRTIIPIINAPAPSGYQSGVGNISVVGALTPAKQSSFTWGVGPSVLFPTITEGLGYEKFSIGPSVVGIKQNKGFTFGLLLQNFFSVAGPSSAPDVNFFYSQLILAKKLKKGWYLYSSPNITADWNAPSGSQWTIPLGAGAGKLIAHSKLPINVKAGLFKYIEHPTDAEWLFQLQTTLILKTN